MIMMGNSIHLIWVKKYSHVIFESLRCFYFQVKERTSDMTIKLQTAEKEAGEYLTKYHTLTQQYTQLERELVTLKDAHKHTGSYL